MDFQLNPDAAEFVPVSPQFAGARINLMEDYPISGSPLKQVPQMDDIQVPSQSEFDEEICQRPREVDPEEKEYQNGVHLQSNDDTDFITERQKIIGFSGNMDDSVVSSTKAEYGDVSSASFLTTTDFHRADISTVDESFSSYERDYDIAKDPMAMSFTPSDFEAAFDKGADFEGEYKKSVDLNAVHNLSNTDLDDKNGSMEEQGPTAQSPELHPELTNLASPETEQPSHTQAFPGEPAELVNLSSQQEDTVFTEHADKPKSPFDLLNMQSESSQAEQQETVRSEHSPLTENYSAEFESEKELVCVDNEQPLSSSNVDNEQPLSPTNVDNEHPLSPSIVDNEQPLSPSTVDIEQALSPSTVDIDETKPIDEASEDALLPENEFQQETDAKDADTPSSLSPEPDATESDLVAPVESDKIPSASPVFEVTPNAAMFKPPQYDVQSYSTETGSIGETQAIESEDICQSPVPESHEICESPIAKSDDIRSASSTEALDVCPSAPTSQQIIDSFEPSVTTARYEVSEHSPAEANDVRESPLPTTDICQSPFEKASDVLSASSTEALDVCPTTQQIIDPFESSTIPTHELRTSSPMAQHDVCQLPQMTSNDACESSSVKENDFGESPNIEECDPIAQILDLQPAEEKRAESPQPTQENLLDFAEEQEVCIKKEVEAEPTTLPLSPQNVEEKIASPVDDMICRVKSTFEQEAEIVPEPKETIVPEPEVVETKPQEVEKPVKEPALSLSESMQEFTGLECQLQPKPDDVPVSSPIPEIQEEVSKKEDVPEVKETVEPEKPAEPDVEEACKVQQAEKVEAVLPEVKEPETEKVVPEASETKVSAVTAAAAAVAIGAAAVAATQSSKAKVKAPPKPSSKTAAPKTAQKSNPTSPSKSATRALTGATKKPTTTGTARPKDLDAPKKSAASSIATSNRVSAAKPPPKTTATTATTKGATKLSANATTKPKRGQNEATTASKPVPSEKKPTANGDVKPLSKPAAAAKTSTTVKAAPTARSATTKTATTKTSTLTTTTKARPVSATTAAAAAKTSAPAKSSAATTATTTAISRPKSVPTTGIAGKPRQLSGKPPIIDKQVKETANKQISMARTTAKTTTRLSMTSTTTTSAAKRMSSTTKTTTAASPIKKVTSVSKVSGRVAAVAKTTPEKAKVLQNGVSEKIEINAIIDDVPKKDLSPVVTPNDNQLIMSSD